ncbi:hypothetical protein TWF718_007822 [Orbilia javanica]|uniref:Uncharacterized protein n=1 Tax=Orbilia javanica TaxID=47235 RepID=A0AAN8MPA3_9PEZI
MTSPPPSFLTLPLELRNEIYKYILPNTPPPPLMSPVQLKNPPPYCPVSHDLSIMRVNQQIHSESSRILYSHTKFYIRIMTSSWSVPAQMGSVEKTQFDVIYEDPWAEVMYYCREDGKGWYCGFMDFTADPKICTVFDDKEVESIPSPRYRHLIRHVKIDILDTRRTPNFREPHRVASTSATARAKVRKLLMPFAYRLKRILSDAGENVEVEINFVTKLELIKREREVEGDTSGRSTLKNPVAPIKLVDHYKELIETSWPLTTGPWGYKLTLPPKIRQDYPELGKEVLQWCDENDELTEAEKAEFEVMRTRFPYLWVMKKGRFTVMEENQDPWSEAP